MISFQQSQQPTTRGSRRNLRGGESVLGRTNFDWKHVGRNCLPRSWSCGYSRCSGTRFETVGIVIWEAAEDVTDGIASYWEDTAEWEKVLLALCAGEMAQLKQFPCSSTLGSQPDGQKFSEIVNNHLGQDRFREMHDTNSQVASLLEIHWSAVTSIALALMEGPWIIVEPTEHPKANRKKHLDGSTLVPILRRHGITAHVRNSQT